MGFFGPVAQLPIPLFKIIKKTSLRLKITQRQSCCAIIQHILPEGDWKERTLHFRIKDDPGLWIYDVDHRVGSGGGSASAKILKSRIFGLHSALFANYQSCDILATGLIVPFCMLLQDPLIFMWSASIIHSTGDSQTITLRPRDRQSQVSMLFSEEKEEFERENIGGVGCAVRHPEWLF